MSNKSLPAYLQQVLEHHVSRSDIAEDEELQGIMQRLAKLNENVEKMKLLIREKRAQRQDP